MTKHSSKPRKLRPLACAATAALALAVMPSTQADPLITAVVETGGDDEATDTIAAQWTGKTFVNGVANEPLPNTPADASYTVGLFTLNAPMFVDRNHRWVGAGPTIPIPPYLEGGEYIMSGNDNRDNAEYKLDITISEASYVYMLIDDRMGDNANANPPNHPEWLGDLAFGDGIPDMQWIVDEGWQPVKTGQNRHGNPDWPDHVGADESADGSINQWSSVYVKRFPAGTLTILAPDNPGRNMYGVVIKAVPKNPTVTKTLGDMFGFSVDITDGSQTSLDTNSVTVTLNNAPVTPQITRKDDVTTISYVSPSPFPASSEQTVSVAFSDTGTPPQNRTETFSFTVEPYGTLTPNLKVTPDTSKPGFVWRVFQNAGNIENSTAKAERTVLGELLGADGNPLPNHANFFSQGAAIAPSTAPNPANAMVPFEIAGVINLSQIAGESNGNFPNDEQMPGIPGIEFLDDGIVAEIITYVELPAGVITMGVNSDDGFHTSAGQINDVLARVRLGEYSGGRGASDTLFRFVVEEAGVYALRTLWEEGNSGANIEWFHVKSDGTKALLNDTANGGLKAYRAATSPAAPYVRKATPLPGATGVPADVAIEIEIVDTTTTVDPSSVALKVDGSAKAPNVSKTGNTTKVSLPASSLFASGSTHSAELSYSAGGTAVTRSWSFTVAQYLPLPADLVTAIGSGRDRGFRIKTVQSETARPGGTADAAAEQQLLDNYGAPNIADTTTAGNDGYFAYSGIINFNQDAPGNAGNFNFNNGYEDQLPPGLPGPFFLFDHFSLEVLTFLEFPSVGFYTMGVNSDDGFKVTLATGADTNAPVIGIFNGGRSAANTLFNFGVTQPGVYPFRLIWYEGTGGASAEWFTVTRNGINVPVNADHPDSVKAYRARVGEPAPRPTIGVARSGTGLTITFTGKLQSADNVGGPYADVTGATSPHNVQTASPAKFYRSAQ